MVNTMNILIQGADRRHIGVRTGYLQMIVICIVLSYCTGFKHSLRAVTQWKRYYTYSTYIHMFV